MIDIYVFIFASVLSLIAFFIGARMGCKHGFVLGCTITLAYTAKGLKLDPQELINKIHSVEVIS